MGDVAEVEYLPLDRVSMRPGKNGAAPRVGISLVNHRQLVDPVRYAKFRNCCIGIVCGNTVHYLVADFPQLAQRWLTALTEAWERCALNDMRSLPPPEAGLQALHTENRLLAENASLQEDLAHAQDDLIKRDSALWGDFLAAQEQVLALQKEVGGRARTTYRVEVCTSAARGSETDGRVHVELVGEVVLGHPARSGERLLQHEGLQVKPFQRDQTDRFDIEVREDLGELAELRVRHSPLERAGSSQTWLLEHVKVTNLGSKAVTTFVCEGWLARDDVGEDCTVTLYPGQPAEKKLRFTADIFTAAAQRRPDDSDFGVSPNIEARPYVVLQGSLGKSGRIWLAPEARLFEDSSREHFNFCSPDVGTLHRVKLGYVTQNLGAAEWPLESVHIRDVKKKRSYALAFHRWVRQSGTEFESSLTPAPRPIGPLRSTLSIRVKTGRGASSSGDVEVELFGQNGATGRIQLHPPSSIFEANSVNTFPMSLASVGELKYLVLKHGGDAEWAADSVEVMGKSKGAQSSLFQCGVWNGLGEVVLRKTTPTVLPGSVASGGEEYHITTFTSQKKGSGTTARVFVKLYGERANSRVMKLEGAPSSFRTGGVDTFSTTVDPLGGLKSLKVGHDSSGNSPSWRLERIIITERKTGKDFTFWNRGLLKSGARQICSVELVREDIALEKSVTDYHLTFKTGGGAHASTDAQVFVKIMGSLGTTERLKLRSEKAHFERGQTDTFHLSDLPDVGHLEFLEVSTDGTGRGFLGLTGHSPNWHLEWVTVTSASMQRNFHFPCGTWFDDKAGRRKRLEVAAPGLSPLQLESLRDAGTGAVTSPGPALPTKEVEKTDYEVWIVTSDIREASTDAQVYIKITGSSGAMTENIWLESAKAHFERGSNDYFLLKDQKHVGDEISSVEVGQDNTGRGFLGLTGASPNWHLSSIKLRVQKTGKTIFFPCGEWLDKKRGLSRTLLPAEEPGNRGTAASPSEEASPSPTSPKKIELDDPKRQQSPSQDSPEKSASPLKEGPGKYTVAITTSKIKGASTDANVFVELWGVLGSSGKIKLDSSREHFERGSTDSFFLAGLPDIGPQLLALEIGHDSTGKGVFRGHNPDWHIDQVRVTNAATQETQIFPCGEWLGGMTAPASRRLLPAVPARDDQEGLPDTVDSPLGSPLGSPDKELNPAGQGAQPLSPTTGLVNLLLEITTSDLEGASTDAAVSVRFFGADGVTERITLQSEKEHFERGGTDCFLLEGVEDVGALARLEIGHDATGKGFLGFGGHSPSWHLDVVEVTDMLSRRAVRFPCRAWVGNNKSGGHILLEAQTHETAAPEPPASESKPSPVTTPRPLATPLSRNASPSARVTTPKRPAPSPRPAHTSYPA